MHYKDPQPTDLEKVILLLERMNHTDGPSKVLKAFGRTRFGPGESNDMLFLIRQSYPQFFECQPVYAYNAPSQQMQAVALAGQY